MGMPEGSFIDELDSFLSPYDTKRISNRQLKVYKRAYIAGWEFPTVHVYKGKSLSLRLLFKADNRYLLPDVNVFPNVMEALDFPHVENESRLCVWESIVCCDFSKLQYLVELINEATSLLGKLLAGECTEDFRNGFLSYWEYKDKSNFSGISLCDSSNLETRNVYLYKSKQIGYVFGDTEERVKDWLINHYHFPKNSNQQSKAQRRTLGRIAPTALFCFDNAWTPNEYPDSIEELRLLVVPHIVTDEQFANLIAEALNNRIHSHLAVLLAFQTINGVCFAGLSLSRGLFAPKSKYSGSTMLDGCRESIPYQNLLYRASTVNTLGISIARADKEWVHGRDCNPDLVNLQTTKIAIVGCGSVGSGVAKLLVKSGVTKFILIDNDDLEFANLSRHELGSMYVGENKAVSLRKELQRSFPHVEIISFEEKWQSVLHGDRSEELKTQLYDADLILSATANWGSDLGLISLQEHLDLGPIVFAFTEAHAVAGHIIVHPDCSNSFQSNHVMNGQNVGTMKIPCSMWDIPTLQRLPVCGGAFQPYGAAALSYLHAMATEMILKLINGSEDVEPLRRVWLGDTLLLQANGGRWNPDWISRYGDPGQGNHVLRLHLINNNWELSRV